MRKKLLLILLSLILILLPSCNRKDVCYDDSSEEPKQSEINSGSLLPNDDHDSLKDAQENTNNSNDDENIQNNDSSQSISNVSITDSEKAEIQSILVSANRLDVEDDVFVTAIYDTDHSESLSFMKGKESIISGFEHKPIIIDEQDIFEEINESKYMYLFFNYTDDGKNYKERYDSAFKFQGGSLDQGYYNGVVFVFNREVTCTVSCSETFERLAVIKMPIIEGIESIILRVDKTYENELACIKDIIQDPIKKIRYGAPDISDVSGNLNIKSCFFNSTDSYLLPKDIFVFNQDQYSEKLLIYTEKELFSDSEEDNLYLVFAFYRSSDDVYTLVCDSANYNSGIAELKFKLVTGGGNDGFTQYVVMLKLNGLSSREQISDLHIDFERVPYLDYIQGQ